MVDDEVQPFRQYSRHHPGFQARIRHGHHTFDIAFIGHLCEEEIWPPHHAYMPTAGGEVADKLYNKRWAICTVRHPPARQPTCRKQVRQARKCIYQLFFRATLHSAHAGTQHRHTVRPAQPGHRFF